MIMDAIEEKSKRIQKRETWIRVWIKVCQRLGASNWKAKMINTLCGVDM